MSHFIYAYLSQFFVIAEHDFIQETDIQNVSHMEIYFIILFFFYYGRLHLKSLQNVRKKNRKPATFAHSVYSCFNFMSGFLLHGYTAPRFSEITFASFPMLSADRTQITSAF